MGMYDELVCDFPLPESMERFQDRTFQTKDLQHPCEMTLFKIEADGTLSRRGHDKVWEFNLEPDEPFTFYAFVDTKTPRYDKAGWVEFEATFEGNLIKSLIVYKYVPVGETR